MRVADRYIDKYGTVVNACQFDGSYECVMMISDFISNDEFAKMDYIHTMNCIKLVNGQGKHYRVYLGDYIVELVSPDRSRRYICADKQLFESTYTLLIPMEAQS